ncbi:MAG: cellobiose phosphorylase, partial [Lachnospiraceae bacterium]|nr:cellobiose phosphorylase [Lachnospiraceae bacterium]
MEFIDGNGSFRLKNPQKYSYLYFPAAGENGIRSSLTPLLGGDAKKDQNTFLFEPVSAENLHNNRGTRNFWCRFGVGRAWSASGASAAQEAAAGTANEEEAVLEAGFMWHTLYRRSKEFPVESKITTFVPIDFPDTEVTLVTIRNTGDAAVVFTPVAVLPMYARSADNIRDHRHVTSLLHRARVTEYGVRITPTLTFDERGHKKNELTYYVYGGDENGRGPAGVIPAVEDVIGEGGSFARPRAVYEELPELAQPGDTLDGYETAGTLVFEECRLLPGEEAFFALCAGIDSNSRLAGNSLQSEESGTDGHSRTDGKLPDDGHSQKASKLQRTGIEDALRTRRKDDWLSDLERTKAHWAEQVNVRFSTGDKQFDQYMCWIAFQPILRRIYGCSFLPHHDYGKGGRGWRDLWQDCLALLIMNPDGVRRMLVSNFGGVRMDGSNATIIGSRQGEFIADRNNIARVWMDHGFWPLHTTAFYIHQTGDLGILLEEAEYFKDGQAVRGEEKDGEWNEEYGVRQRDKRGQTVSGTVLEHILVQNLTAFYDVGEHNRIRLRGADWNDALDMAPERGESAAFTFAYAGNLGVLKELLARLSEQGTESVLLAGELAMLLSRDTALYADIAKKQALLREYCGLVRHNCSGEKVKIPIEELRLTLEAMECWWKETLRGEEWLSGKYSFFNGYYDNHGKRVERTEGRPDSSARIEEADIPEKTGDGAGVRMMLTSQVFAIQSGTATEEQTKSIIASADALLYREHKGGYCLNTDFGELKDDLGRMFGFAYGHKGTGRYFLTWPLCTETRSISGALPGRA